MYKYARTKNRAHRVHVEGGRAFKVEQCNLDDAKYFGLLDEIPEGTRCKYCWVAPAEEKELEKSAEQVPALGKNDVPRSIVLLPKRLLAALLAIVAGVFLLGGNASGVVLSPDPSTTPRSSSSGLVSIPTCDPMTLAGCGDLVIIIEKLIDQQLLHHLTIDHAPEVTPSPTLTPLSTPTALPTDANPSATPRASQPSRERPRATSTPTPTISRPARTPRPTAPPAPTATPCFRPGDPQSGKDPCSWPPDDK